MLRNSPYSTAPTAFSPKTPTFWSPTAVVGTAFAALREGLAASREYQQLRSLGVSPDIAIRKALGIGSSAQAAKHGAGTIYIAGKV